MSVHTCKQLKMNQLDNILGYNLQMAKTNKSNTKPSGKKTTSILDPVRERIDASALKVTTDRSRPSVEYPTLPDGKPNPKYTDLLTEYPVIPSQQFGVYSFISPERNIRRREFFMFEEFVKQWNFATSVSTFADFLHYLSHKYKLNIESLKSDLVEFVAEESQTLKRQDVTGEFAGFVEKNYTALDSAYTVAHSFETSVRGFVCLGSYPNKESADARAEFIRSTVKDHDVLVGENFKWVPLDPDLYRLPDINYLHPELNRLHHEKIANESKAKAEFERRVYETKRKAVENNVALARKHGTTVTQTMNEDGNLVNIRDQIDFDAREAAPEVKYK